MPEEPQLQTSTQIIPGSNFARGQLQLSNPPPRSSSLPLSTAAPAFAPLPLHPISARASYAAPSSPVPASPPLLSRSTSSPPQTNPTLPSTPIPSAQSSAPPAHSPETPALTHQIHT